MRLSAKELNSMTIVSAEQMRKADASNRFNMGDYSYAVERVLICVGALKRQPMMQRRDYSRPAFAV